ncbi:glutamate-gated chloride channel-like [Ischnura elegans]|uniref:glutamate-gated chloride channel-like n=1 Tax=Ischnura elegans TaxID=197161 RepID=UPI001ED8A694|nr:glutamate-gated chloride channel-like [Ischnura elegans]
MAGKNFLLWVLALLAAVACVAAVKKDVRNAEAEIIKLLLNPDRYDKRVRPPGSNVTSVMLFDQPQKVTGDPVVVKVNAFIRSVGHIDDRNREYRVSMTLRQTWNDARLKFSAQDDLKYILLTSDEDIWSPDLFFSNEKEGHTHDLLHPNSLVRISPEGDVLYSTRISLKLSCPMDLTNFPMDKQSCFIRMASYAYTTKDLIFVWKDDDPVQSVVDLDMSPFVMQGFGIDYCNSKTNTGEYSCLRTEFLFKRLVHHYILHLFLPLGLLVAASWAPFWLDFYGEDGAPVLGVVGRCLIALLCLLATIIEAARVSTYAPPSSGDARAIDTWTTWCQTFASLVLLEVIIVAVIDRWRRERHRNAAQAEGAGRSAGADGGEGGEAKSGPPPNLLKKWIMGWPTAGQRIDVICRIIFPVVFVIFNITYWSTYADYMGLRSLSSIKKIPY